MDARSLSTNKVSSPSSEAASVAGPNVSSRSDDVREYWTYSSSASPCRSLCCLPNKCHPDRCGLSSALLWW